RRGGLPWWKRDSMLPERGWARRHWRGLAFIAGVIAAGTLFNSWLATCGFVGCPTAAEIQAYSPTEGGRILDRNGSALGQMSAVQRVNVTLDQVPQHVRDAFLATEDRR